MKRQHRFRRKNRQCGRSLPYTHNLLLSFWQRLFSNPIHAAHTTLYSHSGCSCPPTFYGFACEFKVLPSGQIPDNGNDSCIPPIPICSLSCMNGGTCRNGIRNDGSEFVQTPTHNEQFQHCDCPVGFHGLRVSCMVCLCECHQTVPRSCSTYLPWNCSLPSHS